MKKRESKKLLKRMVTFLQETYGSDWEGQTHEKESFYYGFYDVKEENTCFCLDSYPLSFNLIKPHNQKFWYCKFSVNSITFTPIEEKGFGCWKEALNVVGKKGKNKLKVVFEKRYDAVKESYEWIQQISQK